MKTLKGKLILYFSSILLSVTLCLCFYYFYMNCRSQKEELIRNTKTNIEYFQGNINKMLFRCEKLSDYIYLNRAVGKVLIRNYEDESKTYYNYDQDIAGAINALMIRIDNDIVSDYIRGITIKGNNGKVIKYGIEADYVNLDSLENQDWFKENVGNHTMQWLPIVKNDSEIREKDYLIPIVRHIISSDTHKSIGWQFISVSPNIIEEAIDNFEFQNRDILFVYDRKGNCVYSNKKELVGVDIHNIVNSWSEEQEIVNFADQKWIKTDNYSEYSGLTIVQLVDYQVIEDQTKVLFVSTCIVLIITITVAISMTVTLSNNLTKPIKRIMDRMSQISEGDFSQDRELEGKDEIGILGKGINDLAGNVNRLMNQIKEEEAKKKELEYRTLQSQINPHFVYNTLNSIRIMAELQGAKGICDMVIHFGELLKEVSKGVDDKITIEQEFSLVEHYIYLQKIRRKGLIRTEYAVEPGCEKGMIIKFLLQPLVENSVIHGLEGKKGMGFLWIGAKKQGDNLLITIKDNGVGLTREETEQIFTAGNQKGVHYNKVGVKNVQERIQLLYGEQYGLSFESRKGEYTLVKVILPFEKEPVMEDIKD